MPRIIDVVDHQLAVDANESCSRRESVLTQFSKWV